MQTINIIEVITLSIITLAALISLAKSIFKDSKLTKATEQQLECVRQWLLYAVIEAEKYYGSNTGKLKLRMVYSMFLDQFPNLVNSISFEYFSAMVDGTLVKMRDLLDTNKDIKNYVDKGVQ